MSGLSHDQLKQISNALEDAHKIFLRMDGFPVIRVNRKGRQVSAGQPEFGLEPSFESMTFTTYAEVSEVEADEVEASGGKVQFGDRRLITRKPLYLDDTVEMTELSGIHLLTSNIGTGKLLSAIIQPTVPATYWTVGFASGTQFTMTNASGSIGSGNTGQAFTASGITILSTNWYGDFRNTDKLVLRTDKSVYNVYRTESNGVFGDYQFLVKKIGD